MPRRRGCRLLPSHYPLHDRTWYNRSRDCPWLQPALRGTRLYIVLSGGVGCGDRGRTDRLARICVSGSPGRPSGAGPCTGVYTFDRIPAFVCRHSDCAERSDGRTAPPSRNTLGMDSTRSLLRRQAAAAGPTAHPYGCAWGMARDLEATTERQKPPAFRCHICLLERETRCAELRRCICFWLAPRCPAGAKRIALPDEWR
jgi:hypothetical protein